MDLGASPLGALRRIILPMLMPAIFASTVSGLRCDVIDDFVAGALICPVTPPPSLRLGEDLQHGARQRRRRRSTRWPPCCCWRRLTAVVIGFILVLPPHATRAGHHYQGPGNRRYSAGEV